MTTTAEKVTIRIKPGFYQWANYLGIPGLSKMEVGSITREATPYWNGIDWSYMMVLSNGERLFVGSTDIAQ